MARWGRRLWRWGAATVAALLILFATAAGLFRLLTPLLPAYRLQVESWASAALQHPVQIHSMSGAWDWFGPEVTLQDVGILSRDRSRVLVAAREVRLSLDWRSLLHFRLPRPTRVALVAPRLALQRQADGSYSLRGLENAAPGTTDWHATAAELLAQSAEIVLRDGELELFDVRRASPLLFRNLSLRIDNSPDRHHLEGRTDLPPELGRSLGFDLTIQGEGLSPAQWDWQGRLSGRALQPAHWLALAPQPPGYVAAGVTDLDVNVQSRQGILQGLSGEIAARDLIPAPPLGSGGDLALLQGRFDWSENDDGWHLGVDHLKLQRAGGMPWPESKAQVTFNRSTNQTRLTGAASFVRLQDLAALAAWTSPVDSAYVRRLHAFQPTGEISGLSLKIVHAAGVLGEWSVQGAFTDLGVHAAEGYPGFAGLSGGANLGQNGGDLRLNAHAASVDFRPLFRNVLAADTVALTAHVDHDARGWRVATDNFQVANADGAAHGRAALQLPPGGAAPRLDLDATVERGDARNKSRYLPVGIMPAPVVQWLDSSIRSGQVTSGTVAIHGSTADFPYVDGKGGTFDIRFHVQHAELDYSPGWPPVKDVEADVRFLDQGLEAKVLGGSYDGLAITGGTASFKDLSNGVLEVDGTARGDASHGLDFLRTGPLKETLEGYLDGLTAHGDTEAAVHIELPVTQPDRYRLRGDVTLHRVSVGLTDVPALTAKQLDGHLDFGKYGFATQDVHGTLLGGPFSVVIRTPHTDAGSASLLSAKGSATAAGLAELIGYRAERWLTGQTSWQMAGKLPLQAGLGTAGLDLLLRSDLTGLAVGLPAPFAKAAADVQPFKLRVKFDEGGDLDYIASYGKQLGLLLAYTPADGGGLAFDRGALHIGSDTAVAAAPGFAVAGTLPAFDWNAWRALLPAASGSGKALPPAAAERTALPAFLRSVDLTVGRMSAFDQAIDNLHLLLNRSKDGWQGEVQSAPLAGKITIPAQPDTAHPVVLDMDRVLLTDKPAGSAAATGAAPAEVADKSAMHVDPRTIPAMHLATRQFQFGAMTLDNVSLALIPQPQGIALEDVAVQDPSFTISGDGTWLVTPDGQQRTALNVDVESKDVARSLESLGFAPGMTGRNGSIVASMNWQDSPMGDVVHTLSGAIHLKLQDGQITEVQPGAGRLFGLLSLNALPRRVLLNFSDVFAKGFGYDSIEGDFTLQDGDAYTQNLVVKGPAASIHLLGRTGLARQDFDEALIVDTSVGSTLPVVGALAGGVGVGAVVFLLTELFNKPLTQAGELRYHLTGTWANPVLTKVTAPPPGAGRKP